MKTSRVILIATVAIVLSATAGIILYLYLSDGFKKRLVRLAKGEASKWQAVTELSTKASSYLIDYWRAVGITFTAAQMENSAVQSSYPWSSAFISWLFYKAGAKGQFPYSSSHSGYFQQAKANRYNKNAPLRGFRVSEYAPNTGDIVVFTREAGKGYDSSGYFPAHGEIVVETGKNYIKAVGGNVSNSVRISTYKTDQAGKLSGNSEPFIMVIQNNIK